MIRVTFELLPGGDATRARVIGLLEIANIGGTYLFGDYLVTAKKTPPFKDALEAAWRRAQTIPTEEDEEVLVGRVEGHHRQRRGVYDLAYRALRDLVGSRNP